MKPPCSPETQDEAKSLITVDDFDVPALREDAKNQEEKKSESPAQNQDGQVFTKTVPETSHPAPLPATAKYSCSPCSVSPSEVK